MWGFKSNQHHYPHTNNVKIRIFSHPPCSSYPLQSQTKETSAVLYHWPWYSQRQAQVIGF